MLQASYRFFNVTLLVAKPDVLLRADHFLHAAMRRDNGAVAAPAEELGDLLFSVVNLARWLEVDAESCLRGATGKFSRRFQAAERLAQQRGLHLPEMSLEALDGLWAEVKNSGSE